MAVQVETLVATLEARVDKFERGLAKARATAGKEFAAIGAQGDQLEAKIVSIGSRGAKGIDGLSKSVGGLTGQAGNLASQFNDIGVQLAGGTSPFLIAIQQGTQISQVLNQAGQSGASFGALLTGALGSILSPASLATFAVIALGGAAVQYFASLIDDGEKSAEVLKQEAALIQQVADKWGAALPALQAYAAERQALADQKSVDEAVGIAIADTFSDAQKTVSGLSVDVAELVQQLIAIGAAPEQIVAVQEAFGELNTKVSDGTATAEDAQSVHDALAAIFRDTSLPAAASLAAQFLSLAGAIATASAAAAGFKSEAASVKLNVPLLPYGKPPPTLSAGGRYINEEELQTINANNTQSLFQKEQARLAKIAGAGGGGGRSGGGSRAAAKSEAEREAEAVTKLIDKLEFERSLIGLSSVDRQKAIALRQAEAGATAEQKAQIAGLIEETYAAKEAQEALDDQMQMLNDLGRDVLGGFISDLRAGKSASEALAGALEKVADKLLDIALDSLFSGGKGGGGGIGGFISSIFGGFRAAGGPVQSGKAYVVGEKGPEILTGASGRILPNSAVGAVNRGSGMARQSGGGPQPVSISIDVTGANGDKQIQAMVQQGVQAGLGQYDKTLNRNIGSKLNRWQGDYG